MFAAPLLRRLVYACLDHHHWVGSLAMPSEIVVAGVFLPMNSLTALTRIDFKIRVVDVDDVKVKLQIIDTAGQERYHTSLNVL